MYLVLISKDSGDARGPAVPVIKMQPFSALFSVNIVYCIAMCFSSSIYITSEWVDSVDVEDPRTQWVPTQDLN